MPRYQAPAGVIVRGWTVTLDRPRSGGPVPADCGARRFAYNWAVAQIKVSFGVVEETGEYDSAVWSAYSLRKRWNQVKGEAAPWWAENSKEAYAGGIAAR